VGLVVPLVCLARLVWVVRSVRLALLVVGRVALVALGLVLLGALVAVQALTVTMRKAVRFLCLRYKAKMGATILALLLPAREPVAVAVVPVLSVLTLPLTLVGPVGQV
jgi:hypothetical protein